MAAPGMEDGADARCRGAARATDDQPLLKAVVGSVIGRVAPAVLRQIDVNDLVEVIDVDAIAADLDLDALVDRLDINAIAADLDLDALVDRLDINAIAARLDLDALIDRVDVAQLTAGATQDVALSGLDLFRRQLVRVDATVESIVDRVLRRGRDDRPVAPKALDGPPPRIQPDHGSTPSGLRRREVSGHYAGPVTRIIALIGDLFVCLSTFGFSGAASLYLISTVSNVELTIDSGGWVTRLLLWMWILAWFWLPVMLFGRTLAMAVLGLAVVRRDGGIANGRRAFVRALVLPLSVAMLAIGLVGMVLGRERRTLHDYVAGTTVVYDWGARQAEQPITIREQLSARVRRRTEAVTREQ